MTVTSGRPGAPTPPAVAAPGARRRWMPRDGRARIGLAVIAGFVLVAVVGPFLVTGASGIGPDPLAPPSAQHWLGTTQTGQDVLAQLVVATRGSLLVGALAGLLATVLSIVVGVVGGYVGGRVDEALSLLSNVTLVIPSLPLVILVTHYLDGGGILAISVVIGLTSWAASARVLRAQTRSVRARDHVAASRALGERPWRMVLVEVVPNLLPVIAAQFVFAVIFAILTEAGLSFLGLGGVDHLTWGTMLYFAQNAQALAIGAWWWFIPPGLAIALLGCALSLLNLSLDEVINPRLRGSRSRRDRRAARRPAQPREER
ncbi:ABC transporter permease [Actinoalloteichus caeruleus]|uniref:ABC transporter permease n=1 Tax=Actinoalloteichus cyanogriseus TaxID=2893586 RepID=UPI003BB8F28E